MRAGRRFVVAAVGAAPAGSGASDQLRTLAVVGTGLLVVGVIVGLAQTRRRPVAGATGRPVAPWPSREADDIDRGDHGATRATSGPPTAAAYVDPHDVAAVHVALERSGISAQELAEAADVFAAVVRGATLIVVDAGRPGAVDLLRSVRRRIDDGWSDCAVVAYVAAWGPADLELEPLVDALARHPITPADLDLAVRVARSQADDRRGVTSVVRSPLAGPVPQTF